MATQTIKLTGKVQWARVFEFNKDKNEDFHGPGGAYTLDLLLEKEELDKLTASGSRLKPVPVDDGIKVKFKRKHIHPSIPHLGGAPQVVDKDGNPWDTEKSGLIGNDSLVTIAVDVYDTKMGKGSRLSGVKVLDQVVYEGSDSDEEPKQRLPF